ncbi:MAG TPA: zinc-binding dehydrogenase [Dehalococcoidia bacterium]|nr:zinc-binding dehydrogenase [Dehalococcoidia bacterium]
MRATVMRDGQLIVTEVPEPVPGPGNMLVETIACGICGSDLHALKHLDQMVALSDAMGIPADVNGDIVMGHEFSARVLELGPGASGFEPGDVIVSIPMAMTPEGPELVGYAASFPGGYGERMVLSPMLSFNMPEGLDPRHAALTEPMAVGVHAVARSAITEREGAIVLGCGPIGLAIVAGLRLKNIEPIIAADYSPKRRGLAAQMGAHVTIDPREKTAIDAWNEAAGRRTPVVFEAIGVPGVLDQIMRFAPRGTRIVVAGVCMEPDTVYPLIGVTKELSLQFVLGYDPMEFKQTLDHIASGAIDVAPLITGEVGIAGVPEAFDSLSNPEEHAKILVEPALG